MGYHFENKEYRRMFHPKLPEICLHVTKNLRISDYELQRTFRVSKDDVIYIYVFLSFLGVISIEDGDINRAKVIANPFDLPYYEEKVIELVGLLTEHFENELKQERLNDEYAEQAKKEAEITDPLLEEAILFFMDKKKETIEGVQRHFRIGYNRTVRILEMLEDSGIISSPDSKGVRTLITKDT